MAFGSTPDWFHLSDEHDIVWESRPHPVAMGTGLPVGVLVTLVGIVVVGWSTASETTLFLAIGFALALVGVSLVLVRYLVWTNTRYVITTAELYKKDGVVSRDVTQFRLERVQNISLEQDAVGRLLGYGNLTVYTAGSGDPELIFEHVPRPDHASSLLSDQLQNVSERSGQHQQP
ncbi:PH domain-containing protein [Halostagnicola kamekurae]|uniref:PH domain-containing protein n=1 Tax=Halostagnicola kamekurae TaxID=619731 RepID=A0A1I6P197_9EURY|nr:PH domain-containing protein [Halostagnicola kamekurae]SFS33915.1 PH domain-containing protein [Halostagnicola kamekurae]